MIIPELLAFVAAIGAGAFGALVGVGGGLVIVPLLTVVLGVEIHTAIGVSLLGVIAVSSSATVPFLRAGLTNRHLGLALLGPTTVGGIFGGFVAGLLDARLLNGLFGVVLVAVTVQMLRARSRSPAEVVGEPGMLEIDARYVEPTTGEVVAYRARGIGPAAIMSLFAGAISGLLGVGGGIVNVPTLNVLMGVPIRVATATSTYMLGPTAAAGVVLYLARGQVDLLLSASVVIGVLLGAAAGAALSRRLPREVLTIAFVIVAALFALQMLLRLAGVG